MIEPATQLELGLKKPKAIFDETHVEFLIAALKAGATAKNRGWLTSTELGARSWSAKRDLRIIKGMSRGRIVSFPGSPGYKLAAFCTVEEIAHCRRATVAQVRQMLTNVRQVERAAHAGISK